MTCAVAEVLIRHLSLAMGSENPEGGTVGETRKPWKDCDPTNPALEC
jgi:hypothetical protein